MLELIQGKYFTILTGEGRNNFIIEYNEDREEDEPAETEEAATNLEGF
jgi:segregation and condensation protein A